ncbi:MULTISPECIES: TetR/AcrR family transcriptional regulator [Amycolatopsis]|uniref:TetR family transcriptional regulator n=1 Tax=Amycolatopsis dendrobii TaxID=2760662 RepID=A0A7W3VT59_9PSEU|nr:MULTISPECIES: TetR family transcriptional regulator [Amycolatopsis]MBB1152581.1 TetR family transcriptional regulator [Amycolatopsis dendrobii]UKD52232.1 TetR family transcriptional regulator [Amycolatopsis sp. FU40]
MTGRTRPTRAETRRRILDAAFAVFGEQGIAATKLTEVAAAAGLTKGAVYSSFASKDELVLALMEEHAAHRLEASLTSFAEADDGGAGLANVAAVLMYEMRADAVWHRLLAEFFAMAHHDDRRRDALRRRRREVRDTIARALNRLAEGLALELPLPAEEFAVVLLALSNGLAVEADIDDEAVPDGLLGRVLTLIAGDAVAKVQAASDLAAQPPPERKSPSSPRKR